MSFKQLPQKTNKFSLFKENNELKQPKNNTNFPYLKKTMNLNNQKIIQIFNINFLFL